MVVQLVLVYCLAAEPTACVERRPLPEEPGTGLMACVRGAQVEAARWLAEHPRHVLARYRCEVGARNPERGA